jgi:hypothetical protein
MSLGGPLPGFLLKTACNYAYDREVLLVAAAGNSGLPGVLYPARFDSVIAVGAAHEALTRAEFSSYGPKLEVVAPGTSILSTMPTYPVTMNEFGLEQDYDYAGGTSMSTPHVAGALALFYSQCGRRPATARQRLSWTAYRPDNCPPLECGAGLIDVHRLIRDCNTCFLAGTPVAMADGSSKNIEDVVPGDRVRSFDLAGRRVASGVVTRVLHHAPEEMAGGYLVINGKLRVTGSHPLYINGRRMLARDARVSDVMHAADGSRVVIESVEVIPESAPTYDLEIGAPEGEAMQSAGAHAHSSEQGYIVGEFGVIAFPKGFPIDLPAESVPGFPVPGDAASAEEATADSQPPMGSLPGSP